MMAEQGCRRAIVRLAVEASHNTHLLRNLPLKIHTFVDLAQVGAENPTCSTSDRARRKRAGNRYLLSARLSGGLRHETRWGVKVGGLGRLVFGVVRRRRSKGGLIRRLGQHLIPIWGNKLGGRRRSGSR